MCIAGFNSSCRQILLFTLFALRMHNDFWCSLGKVVKLLLERKLRQRIALVTEHSNKSASTSKTIYVALTNLHVDNAKTQTKLLICKYEHTFSDMHPNHSASMSLFISKFCTVIDVRKKFRPNSLEGKQN